MKTTGSLPGLLQPFFLERLLRQMRASPHTIAGYRDSFRLLIAFAVERVGKAPSDLNLEDLDAPLVGAFLDHIEKQRANSARTRNYRLAAIHTFFRYVALREPACALFCQRVLAIPNKRFERKTIEYLAPCETEALLNAPLLTTWTGRRDRTLLLLLVQTGLRVSELTALRCRDVVLGTAPHVSCEGNDARPCAAIPSRRLPNGSARDAGPPMPLSFPASEAQPSAGMLSNASLPSIQKRHERPVLLSLARQYPRTCCGTQRRWTSCNMASTEPS